MVARCAMGVKQAAGQGCNCKLSARCGVDEHSHVGVHRRQGGLLCGVCVGVLLAGRAACMPGEMAARENQCTVDLLCRMGASLCKCSFTRVRREVSNQSSLRGRRVVHSFKDFDPSFTADSCQPREQYRDGFMSIIAAVEF